MSRAYACEIKWCLSGLPATTRSSENIGDGCFTIRICSRCYKLFGDELPTPSTVERCLEAADQLENNTPLTERVPTLNQVR